MARAGLEEEHPRIVPVQKADAVFAVPADFPGLLVNEGGGGVGAVSLDLREVIGAGLW